MITFILPIGSENDYELAFNILLPSFNFYKNNLSYQFIIIYRPKDLSLLILNLKKIRKTFSLKHFKYIDETKLLLESNINNSYYLQMYLKLKIASIIKTKYYVTLDADVIFTKKFSTNSFTCKKKPIISIYKNCDLWTKRVNNLLNLQLDSMTNQTPFIFVTKLVKDMLEKIDVYDYIINHQCSEYTLFYGYLNKFNKINKYFHKKMEPCGVNKNIILRKTLPEVKDFTLELAKNFMIVIQSRINYHYKLKEVIDKIVPNNTFKILNIAMLTVAGGEKYVERYKYSFNIKKNYCKTHNYELFLEIIDEVKDGWFKINKLLEVMKTKKHDYIFVSDADVTITNKDKKIERIIKQYYDQDALCYLTTDLNSINSGNTIWKVCDKSINILNKILEIGVDDIRYSLKTPFKPKGIYEQPSIIYLYNKYEDLRKYFKIIPQFEINSYCANYVEDKNILSCVEGVKNRSTWRRGDFLVHYAGINYDCHFSGNVNYNHQRIIKVFEKEYIQRKAGIDTFKIS